MGLHLLLLFVCHMKFITGQVSPSLSDIITKKSLQSAGLTFGKISIHDSTDIEQSVFCLAEDLLHRGHIIYTDGASIKQTSGFSRQTLAGSPKVTGYQNGVGLAAKFSFIFSFAYLNQSHIVIADFNNACLRLLDLSTKSVTDYAGVCTSRGTNDGPTATAKFQLPKEIIRRENQFFIIDSAANSLRKLNVSTSEVTTFISANSKLTAVSGLAWSTTSETKLFILTAKGILQTDVADENGTLSFVYEFTATGHTDGDFSNASFPSSNTLTAIGQDVYVTAGFGTSEGRIRVIDMSDEYVSSICLNFGPFIAGEVDICRLPKAYGLKLVDDTLYIGGIQNIYKLKIQYDICSKPPPAVENAIWVGSTATGKYLCNKGYEKTAGELRQRCSFKGWYGQRPTCTKEVFECLQLPPVVDRSLWNGTNRSVTFNCIQGYEISSGNHTLHCNASKQWEGEVPVCAFVGSSDCVDLEGWLGLTPTCLYAFAGITLASGTSFLAAIIMAAILFCRRSGSPDIAGKSAGLPVTGLNKF